MEKKKAILHVDSFNNGLVTFSVSDYGVRAMLKNLFDLCWGKYGGYVKLELSPPYRQRTLPENAKYWAMCTEYANYLGSTKEQVSNGVKWRACDEGLWELVDVPFSKTGKKEPKSTADSDVREMSILIDVLYRIAAEDGYVFTE